jgi:hypothetical protein
LPGVASNEYSGSATAPVDADRIKTIVAISADFQFIPGEPALCLRRQAYSAYATPRNDPSTLILKI